MTFDTIIIQVCKLKSENKMAAPSAKIFNIAKFNTNFPRFNTEIVTFSYYFMLNYLIFSQILYDLGNL